jgi:hypothetical protein
MALNKTYRVTAVSLSLTPQGLPDQVTHTLTEIDGTTLMPLVPPQPLMNVTLPFAQRQQLGTVVDSALTARP